MGEAKCNPIGKLEIKSKHIHTLELPCQSSDVHPIENLCKDLKIYAYRIYIQSD